MKITDTYNGARSQMANDGKISSTGDRIVVCIRIMVLGLLKEASVNLGLSINVICLGSTATFFLWFLEKSVFLSSLLKDGLLQLATFQKPVLFFLETCPCSFNNGHIP